MEVGDYIDKIKLLLNYVFDRKIVLYENQTQKLLKLLESPGDNNIGKQILDAPCFSDLILDSLKNLSYANTSVKVFLIEIVTIIFKNELQFIKMQMQGFQIFANDFCILGNSNMIPPPNLHLALIKLATVQISHCSGLTLCMKQKSWKNILYTNIHERPKRISEAAYKFMAILIWRLHGHKSEEDLIEVLGYIIEPIKTTGYLNVPALDTETDIELSNKIYSHISALLAVLNEGGKHASVKPNKVVSLIRDYFLLDHTLYEIYKATKRLCLLKLLNSCFFRYAFTVFRHLLVSKQTDDFCNMMTAFHRNCLVQAIQKREAITVIDFIIESNLIWSHFEKSHANEFNFPIIFERNGSKYDFSLQLLVNLLMPMFKHYAIHRGLNYTELTDVMELFPVKMGRIVTDYIISCCYLYGTLLEEDATMRKVVIIYTLKELQRLKGHLTEPQAGPVFQSLYYLLDVFVASDDAGGLVIHENTMDHYDLRLLSQLLEAMKMLLKDHHIPWYENLEIVSVQANLLNLLKQNFLTAKHVVQVLDLINICVSKFLSPNMSLLVESDNTQCNTLSEIGKIIKLYAQHDDWEVRDSALNLLNSCTEISFIKYVPLQKVIRENNLMILASKAGLADTEYYPQCAALNCLSTATRVDGIWQDVLAVNPHINLQLIYILKNHGEGIVRKEIVNVLTGMYANQKVTPSFQNTLYEVMLTAALDDFHWEVQLAALNFWKKAIHNQLTYRGMLDGVFPPVTFSKEKRKIIVLNSIEIQRQLTGIMDDLSRTGCLTVLLECMKEIHNIEVMEQAYSLAKELLNMLDKYKFERRSNVKDEPEDVPRFMEEDNSMPLNLSITNEEERNRVIDTILNENQNDLILYLRDNYYRNKMEEMDIEGAYYPQRSLVSADAFIDNFKNNNYSVLIQDKKICYSDSVNTLNGQLDEMLDTIYAAI